MDQLSRLQCQFRRAIYPFMPFAFGKRKRIRPIEDYGRISRSRDMWAMPLSKLYVLWEYKSFSMTHHKKKPCVKQGKPHEFFLKMEELQEKCDIISFHTPLITKGPYPTFHLANKTFFNALKKATHHYQYKPGGLSWIIRMYFKP